MEKMRNEPTDRTWHTLYARYAGMIINYALKRGCSESMAEDVLQETMLSLWLVMPRFQYNPEKGRFRSYLFRITRNKVIDAFRRNRRYADVDIEKELKLSEEDDTDWDRAFDEQILTEAIAAVIKKVQLKTFEAFRLTFIEGKQVKDVAKLLGISANLVSQHKFSVQQLIVKEANRLRNEYGE